MGRNITTIGKTKIVSVKLNKREPFSSQLRRIRISMGITGSALAREIGCHVSNMSHYEKQSGTWKMGSTEMAFKYAKALGAKRVIIEL
jgi:transcriptional regulator with XRE-family HTH domain